MAQITKKVEPIKGDKRKAITIALISAIAIIAIALLLFLTDVFVGKAVFIAGDGNAGLKSASASAGQSSFQTGIENTVYVTADIGTKKSVAFMAEVELKDFLIKDAQKCEDRIELKPDWGDTFLYCDYDTTTKTLTVEYATLDYTKAVTGQFDLFGIKMKSMTYYDQDNEKEINLKSVSVLDLASPHGELITNNIGSHKYAFSHDADADGKTPDPCPYDAQNNCPEAGNPETCDGDDNTGDGHTDEKLKSGSTTEYETVCLTDTNCGSHGNACSGTTPKCVAGVCSVDPGPSGDDNITISLLLAGAAVDSTASIDTTKEYTVQITIAPDGVDLPENHLVIITVDYGSTQKVLFANRQNAVADGGSETIEFEHNPLLDSGFTVSVVVWENYLSATSTQTPLIAGASTTYGS